MLCHSPSITFYGYWDWRSTGSSGWNLIRMAPYPSTYWPLCSEVLFSGKLLDLIVVEISICGWSDISVMLINIYSGVTKLHSSYTLSVIPLLYRILSHHSYRTSELSWVMLVNRENPSCGYPHIIQSYSCATAEPILGLPFHLGSR